jgi:hypothetical protein
MRTWAQQEQTISILQMALLAAFRWLLYDDIKKHIATPVLLKSNNNWSQEYRADVGAMHRGKLELERLANEVRP